MMRLKRFVHFCLIMVGTALRIGFTGIWNGNSGKYLRKAQLQRRGSMAICRTLGVTVDLEGEIPGGKPMLVVSNHIGLLDPWVLASIFDVAFAAKMEMAHWPLFKWIGKAVGLIYVDRSRVMNTNDFVSEVRERMRNGVGVLVFPEGTTADGIHLLPFKTGGFAAVANMEDGYVLPVYMWASKINDIDTTPETRTDIIWVEGTSMLIAAWRVLGIRSSRIQILVGSPIPTGNQGRKELARIAQDQVEAMQRTTYELH